MLKWIELFQHWDITVFFWINHGWSHPWLNPFFNFLSDLKDWYIPIAATIILLLWKGGPRGRFLVLALILAVTLADQSENHIKHWVNRKRPCVALAQVNTPEGVDTSPSFPSGHASNISAVMLVLGLTDRKRWWVYSIWALAVGASRIYLGVHYPSDVLAGYCLGLFMGWWAWLIAENLKKRWLQHHLQKN
jgi:undecaprenyl-diphosphatase